MSTLKALKDFLTLQEGVSYNAYKDAFGFSIGVGHFLTPDELKSGLIHLKSGPVEWKNGLTEARVEELLDQDIAAVQALMLPHITAKLNPCQLNALTSFVFNEGIGHFLGSTLLRDINSGLWEDVPTQFARWNLSDGQVNQGLVKRRALEAAMFTQPCNQ